MTRGDGGDRGDWGDRGDGVRAQEGVDVGGQEPPALLAVLRPVFEPWVCNWETGECTWLAKSGTCS